MPTTDPDAALSGMMLPAGDAKGAALALMVEILAATFTGANYSYEATSFFDAEGKPPCVGQFMIAINPNDPLDVLFGDRLEQLVEEIAKQQGARLPGARRLEARAKCAEQGIVIEDYLREEIEKSITL